MGKVIFIGFSIGLPDPPPVHHFAPEWFGDALHEARTGKDHNSRRREILFSVCAVESYLVEWVWDEVIKPQTLYTFNKYFPDVRLKEIIEKEESEKKLRKADREELEKRAKKDRAGICDRWKRVIKEVYDDKFIPQKPIFQGEYWENFLMLVKYRDGLVHAHTSRPMTPVTVSPFFDPHIKESAETSKIYLDRLPSGWAVCIIIELIEELHKEVGTAPPSWLDYP
jgi:hypothetical protein